MTRSTIDFGIDLGTTNSEIAVFTAGRSEIVKDSENREATPSAVWFDAKGRKHVGQRAKDQHESDGANAKIEFKRQMGNDQRYLFAATGKSLLPEELSAEVLMHLKGNVQQWLNEDLRAAVITVPADFSGPQIEATKRAARLAGLEVSPFVQEPVAAATAYGFEKGADADNARWLVYDFGGGTFDAALMRRRDGMIRIENHGGDKELGGKDMDWAIVERLLIPALMREHRLEEFHRGNPRWNNAMAKLKIESEAAKIRLSRVASTTIDIEALCKEAPLPFEFELKRADLEPLVEPMIAKSIRLCRQVLQESRLDAQDIEKLILVGGPTLMPYLRERLADRQLGLGIPLEFGVDPFTVVARGAAIFAATQPLAAAASTRRAGQYHVVLDYQAIGPDTDPLVSGQVQGAAEEDFAAWTIEFVNAGAVPPWRSGRLGLSPDGRFMTNLWAEPGRENRFDIELADRHGVRQTTLPAQFPYLVGAGIGPQMLIHDIGIALKDNTVELLFKKGQPLPARKRVNLKSQIHAVRGSATDAVMMPLVEGGERRADRNQLVGALRIAATDFVRDLPAGSDVEVTVLVDESRIFLTRAYIPLLDREFEMQIMASSHRAEADDLAQQVQAEKRRLAEMRNKVERTDDTRTRALLARIDEERLDAELDAALQAASQDQDAGDRCAARLHDLQVALDRIEENLHWPEEVKYAEGRIDLATRTVDQHGTAAEKAALPRMVQEVREAIELHEAGLLRARAEALDGFQFRIWMRSDEYLTDSLEWLEGERDKMKNPAEAAALLAECRRALNASDRDAMRRTIQGLIALLPRDVVQRGPFGSTVLRGDS